MDQEPALGERQVEAFSPSRQEAEVSRRELRMVLVGLMMALTLAALDQNIVATALPRITGDLGGFQHLSWVVTAFIVTSTVSAPLYGRLSDLYGRKPAFSVSIVLFLVGSIACGLAGDLLQLILARALQGLGAGGLIVLAQTVIGDLVSPRERGRYQGLFAAVFAACSVAGPLIGGLITQYASWRWIFYVNLPVGAAALAIILAFLRPHDSHLKPRVDFLGALLLIAGTSSLLLLLTWGGGVYGWASPQILSLIAATVVCFGALTLVESRVAQPILPPNLFRIRVFVIGAGVIALAAMALFAAAVYLPLMFQLLMGASPASAGLLISPMMGGVIVASFVGGRMVSRTGRYKLFPVLGLGVATLSYVALAWAARDSVSVLPIEGVLVFMGAGIGFVMPNLTTAIQNAVGRGELGGATAAAAFLRSLGGALGVAASGAALTSRLSALPSSLQAAGGVLQVASYAPQQRAVVLAAYRSGLSHAFALGAVVAAAGFVLVLFLPELPLRGGAPPAQAGR